MNLRKIVTSEEITRVWMRNDPEMPYLDHSDFNIVVEDGGQVIRFTHKNPKYCSHLVPYGSVGRIEYKPALVVEEPPKE